MVVVVAVRSWLRTLLADEWRPDVVADERLPDVAAVASSTTRPVVPVSRLDGTVELLSRTEEDWRVVDDAMLSLGINSAR